MRSPITVTGTSGSKADFDLAARVRYSAYQAAGHIGVAADRRFADSHDQRSNAEILLCWHGNQAVGTMRVIHKTAQDPLAALSVWATYGESLLTAASASDAVVEFSRFAVEPRFQGPSHFRVKLALLKAALTVAVVEQAQYCVGAARDEHLAFYSQLLKMKPIGEPRVYPGLNCRMTLMVGDLTSGYAAVGDKLPEMYPTEADLAGWKSCRRVSL